MNKLEKSPEKTILYVCAVPWGMFSTMGDIMSTVGGILSTVEGVQYHGGQSFVI